MFGSSPSIMLNFLAATHVARGYSLEEKGCNWTIVEKMKYTIIYFRPCRVVDLKQAIEEGWSERCVNYLNGDLQDSEI